MPRPPEQPQSAREAQGRGSARAPSAQRLSASEPGLLEYLLTLLFVQFVQEFVLNPACALLARPIRPVLLDLLVSLALRTPFVHEAVDLLVERREVQPAVVAVCRPGLQLPAAIDAVP